jgi:hypothetical protein
LITAFDVKHRKLVATDYSLTTSLSGATAALIRARDAATAARTTPARQIKIATSVWLGAGEVWGIKRNRINALRHHGLSMCRILQMVTI